MNMDIKDKNQIADPENELYFSEYIKPLKEEEDPENINLKGEDMTEDEKMEYENDVERIQMEDYGDHYMKEGK